LTIERDHHGFDAPAPLGHPGRAGLPKGHSTGPEIGERLPDFELPDAQARLTAAGRLLEALKIERAQAAVDLRRAHSGLADALEGTEFGRESAQSSGDRRLAAAERIQSAVTPNLEQLHALLDDEQRE
jgi:hypothetical protein